MVCPLPWLTPYWWTVEGGVTFVQKVSSSPDKLEKKSNFDLRSIKGRNLTKNKIPTEWSEKVTEGWATISDSKRGGEGRGGKEGLKEGRSHNTYLLADHLLQRWPVSPLSSHLQTLLPLQGRVLRYLFLLVAVVCWLFVPPCFVHHTIDSLHLTAPMWRPPFALPPPVILPCASFEVSLNKQVCTRITHG